ncbi:MAG: YraN family protein [Saprospiraceae bacterium]
MSSHNELGKQGERMAANFLAANGYEILARNWRANRAEIDIIARQGDTLVFVEVKTRSDVSFGTPETFVSRKKQSLLAGAATAYMLQTGHEWAIRFDVVSVVIAQGEAPR